MELAAATDQRVRRPVLHNVQILRFIAAAAVVIGHSADRGLPAQSLHPWFWSVPWWNGVDLFFVISGFIMAWLSRDAFGVPGAAADFLKRRAVRIIPPYWFFTTLTVIAVSLLGGRFRGTSVDLGQLLTSYTFLPWPRLDGKLNPILAQGWTLNYEAFFYVAFAAVLLSRRGLPLLCTGFALLTLLGSWLPASWFMLSFWARPLILEFVAGILLAQLHARGFRLALPARLATVALAVLIYSLPPSDFGERWDLFFHSGLAAIVLSASFILAREPERRGAFGRFLELGGDASYAIYLSHYALINLVLLAWAASGVGMPWVGITVAVAVAIASGMLFFLLVERPVTRRLQDLAKVRGRRRLDCVAP